MKKDVSMTTPAMVPARTEADQGPVVPGAPPPTGLPAVVVLALVTELGPGDRRVRQQQVLPRGEGLVVGRDHGPAEVAAGEVGQVEEVGHRSPDGSGRGAFLGPSQGRASETAPPTT